MKAYSVDLRERVVAAYKTGHYTIAEGAAWLSVGKTFVNERLRRQRETQSLLPKAHAGGAKAVLAVTHKQSLQAHLVRQPDATLAEWQQQLLTTHQLRVSPATLCRSLQELQLTRKKAFLLNAAMHKKRQLYRQQVAAIAIDRLGFIEEMGLAANLTRLYGRSRRGQRVWQAIASQHSHRLSVMGTMRVAGVQNLLTCDGAIKGEIFEIFIEAVVAELQSGDVVVMDNVAVHKRASLRDKIAALGAKVLFLSA
jgi:transposase